MQTTLGCYCILRFVEPLERLQVIKSWTPGEKLYPPRYSLHTELIPLLGYTRIGFRVPKPYQKPSIIIFGTPGRLSALQNLGPLRKRIYSPGLFYARRHIFVASNFCIPWWYLCMPAFHGGTFICLHSMVVPLYACTPWWYLYMPALHGGTFICLHSMVVPLYACTPWWYLFRFLFSRASKKSYFFLVAPPLPPPPPSLLVDEPLKKELFFQRL